ncbi:MAG: M14 family zinc carboxypeptidase [Chloroflexota bacterium]
MSRPAARRVRPTLLACLAVAALVSAPGTAVASRVATPLTAAAAPAADFPVGAEGFHTYAELAADSLAVANAHPAIVKRFSIGKSYQGRDLWAVKISDNVNVDEAEPEVYFDGGTHAREHMSVEMTLAIMHWLVNGYGTDATITRLVNTREIWIVFNVNPDGSEYDISGGKYHGWRKNRQPTPGSTSIGTDLNRNFDYHWGCCAGSSTNPAANLYRGPSAFSAPETRAVRDFINSRVIGGRQQIRTMMTFHTDGRLVLWPFGYTMTDIPPDMTAADHAVAVAIAKAIGAKNGYKPEQASDLYISAGTTRDWAYGVHRIFAYTIEMTVGAYADDSTIGPETLRNKSSVLYLIDAAGCPYALVNASQSHCGPLWDDFETSRGWTVNPDGTDTATHGMWQRANPAGTSYNGARQLGTTTSGSADLVTGAAIGGSTSANNVDGGVTSVRSPDFSLPAGNSYGVRFRYYLSHYAGANAGDYLRVRLVSAGGSATLFEELATNGDDVATWATANVSIPASFVGTTAHLVIEAADNGAPGLVEAGIDDVSVMRVAP